MGTSFRSSHAASSVPKSTPFPQSSLRRGGSSFNSRAVASLEGLDGTARVMSGHDKFMEENFLFAVDASEGTDGKEDVGAEDREGVLDEPFTIGAEQDGVDCTETNEAQAVDDPTGVFLTTT